MRDGVDVPGDSLRLIVLDRVPWNQPTILERARREQFGGAAWQDMGVRLRLRQAFGRLIRRGDDRGVFVVLDSRLASRFCTAFPPGMPISRMGLVEAIDALRSSSRQSALGSGQHAERFPTARRSEHSGTLGELQARWLIGKAKCCRKSRSSEPDHAGGSGKNFR